MEWSEIYKITKLKKFLLTFPSLQTSYRLSIPYSEHKGLLVGGIAWKFPHE